MTRKIRVLFTIPNFRTAGSQYVLLSLYRRLDRKFFDPFVSVESNFDLIPEEIPEDRRLLLKWSGKWMQDITSFIKILKQHNIDIIHSWDYKSNYLEALTSKVAGVKYLYTKKNNSWSKRWKLKSILSSHIAFDNPDMKERFFASIFLRNKISFIPHGVDTEVFKPLSHKPHDSFNLVCIGNIGANKNQLYIVKLLPLLPENVVLHLYGKEDKEYRKKLESYVRKNDLASRVNFHGYVDNASLPEVFRKMDVFILPSINEGLPVSILEAMSCGIPALSSDSGGGARYLLDSPNIFSLNNPIELSHKINKFQKMKISEKKRVSKSERQKVLLQHTIEKEVLAYENLYKDIIRKK